MADASKYKYEGYNVTFPAEYVAHVEMNRPKKLNALNMDMWHGMSAIFNKLSRDENVRVVLLSGAGKGFCAGLDIQSDAAAASWPEYEVYSRKLWAMRRHISDCQAAISAMELCEKPVISLVHGVCFGGGLGIAIAACIRLCTSDARFCVKETDVGLAADVGTLTRLSKVGVSYSWAKELAYTAKVVRGDEALRNGFVSAVYDSPEEMHKQGLGMAKLIASKSPLATASTKAIMDFSRDHVIEDGLKYTSSWMQAYADADDVKVAMMGGMKKATPKFSKL